LISFASKFSSYTLCPEKKQADAYATQYEFIVANSQTTTSALHKVV